MMSSYLVALMPFFFALTQAKTHQVYSFREGKSSPDGLKHGARGLDCMRSLHGNDMPSLKNFENDGEEVTDEHIAAALFMAYGEQGINNLCQFSKSLGDKSTRRWLEEAEEEAIEFSNTVNTERRAQSCAGGYAAAYPSGTKNDPNGVYTAFVEERLGSILPEGAGANARLDPPKVVNEAQKPLDEALEGEYSSILCGTYFSAFTDLASIPDFVVFKQGPILDGINELSCGIGMRAMQSVQTRIRNLMTDGMKHNFLINRAEMTATYQNSKMLADEMCAMSSQISNLSEEVHVIKEKVAAP